MKSSYKVEDFLDKILSLYIAVTIMRGPTLPVGFFTCFI